MELEQRKYNFNDQKPKFKRRSGDAITIPSDVEFQTNNGRGFLITFKGENVISAANGNGIFGKPGGGAGGFHIEEGSKDAHLSIYGSENGVFTTLLAMCIDNGNVEITAGVNGIKSAFFSPMFRGGTTTIRGGVSAIEKIGPSEMNLYNAIVTGSDTTDAAVESFVPVAPVNREYEPSYLHIGGTAQGAIAKAARIHYPSLPAYTGNEAASPSKTPIEVTKDAITVSEVVIENETIEYAKNTINEAPYNASAWQDSPIFTNLKPNTTYYFFARVKATSTHESGKASASVAIKTTGGPSDNTGLFIGLSVGGIVLIGAGIFLFFFFKRKKEEEGSDTTSTPTNKAKE